MRRVKGGRDWAYALLAKGWNDGCSMPRLTELLASMTVVNAVGAVNEDGEVDPKAPVRAAIDYSDICLKAYPHQTGGIFARLAKRRERLVRLANAAPRPERDLSKAVNLRPVHPQAPGRASEIGPLGAKQARRVPSMAPPTNQPPQARTARPTRLASLPATERGSSSSNSKHCSSTSPAHEA